MPTLEDVSEAQPAARRRVVAVAHMAQHCELVWVRCREPRARLLAAAPRGMRVSIVEKCGEHGQGTALEVEAEMVLG